MERRVYSELLAWKGSEDRKPLILEGVRQCGKTYILKEFGRREYSSVAYFNFEKDQKLESFFGSTLDPETIVDNLGMYRNEAITPGDTLIVFDEVQRCPNVLTSLKYFREDAPEYHVICAGSLLGLLTSKPDSFPVGNVARIRMHPMDFLEFLRACGEGGLADFIEGMEPGADVPGAFHEKAVQRLREYYVVGGMPAAVESWVTHRDPEKVDGILGTIIKDYRDDFSRHAGKGFRQVTDVWDSIPSQLAKENPKFMYKQVRENGRSAILGDAVQWLEDAGLVHVVHKVETPGTPLSTVSDPKSFKIYLADIGILRLMSGRDASFVVRDDPSDHIYRGVMTENYVLCQLASAGMEKMYYWKKKTWEVDILVDSKDGPSPIEVKSEDDTASHSLRRYIDEYRPKEAYLLSMSGSTRKATVTRSPLYCAGMLFRASAPRTIHVPRQTGTYRRFFEAADWIPEKEGFSITIPASVHARGIPSIIQVYRESDSGYTEVGLDKKIAKDGTVTITASEVFAGFISISS